MDKGAKKGTLQKKYKSFHAFLRNLGVLVLFFSLLLQGPLVFGADKAEAAVGRKQVKNGGKLQMKTGSKIKISFRACGKKAKWKSTNSSVAKVRKKGRFGLVSAKKKGKATIIARVGKKVYKCRLTVKDKAASADSEGSGTGESDTGGNGTGNGSTGGSGTGGNDAGNTGTGGGSETGNTGSTSTVFPTEDFDASTADRSNYFLYFSTHAIHNSTATYYDNGYTNTCCNFDDIAGAYDVAAINEFDYNNGVMAGAYLEVTGPKGKVNVLVTDLMPYQGNEPNCTEGALDLNENTFAKIADKVDGKVKISWKVIAFPAEGPVQYKFKDTSSAYWCEVQVRNHRYPIVKCEVKNADGSYTELPRKQYNYFAAESGLGTGPYTFRVTDIYGHVLEDENIALSPGQIVNGKQNFPVVE